MRVNWSLTSSKILSIKRRNLVKRALIALKDAPKVRKQSHIKPILMFVRLGLCVVSIQQVILFLQQRGLVVSDGCAAIQIARDQRKKS